MATLNHDNIVIDKGFDEWIKSICTEVNRILAIDTSELATTAKTKLIEWKSANGECSPAQRIYLEVAPDAFCFSFAEFEYEKGKECGRIHLEHLVEMRLIDCLWLINDYRMALVAALRQFNGGKDLPNSY